jgi:hypothetical protein
LLDFFKVVTVKEKKEWSDMLIPLLVESFHPVNQSTDVPLNATIKLTFTKYVDESSLQGNIRLRKTNGEIIPITLHYVNLTRTVTIKYVGLLESNVEYTLEVVGGQNGVKGIDQTTMTPSELQFKTIEEIELNPPRLRPISQIGYFLAPSWNPPSVIQGEDPVRYEIRLSTNNDPSLPYLWPDSSNEMNITSESLAIPYQVEAETEYFIHLRSLLGSQISSWVTGSIFTTKIDTQTPSNGNPLTTPLSIIDQNPAHEFIGSVDQIDLLFSQDITDSNPGSFIYLVEKTYKEDISKLDLIKGYGSSFKVNCTVNHTAQNPDIVTLVPNAALPQNKDYTVIVLSGLQGKDSKLASNYSFGFTTQSFTLYGEIENVKEITSKLGINTRDSYIKQIMSQYSQLAFEMWSNGNAFEPDPTNPSNVPFYISRYVELKTAVYLVLTGGVSSGNKKIKLNVFEVTTSSGSSSAATKELESEIEDLEKMIVGGLTRKKRATAVFTQRGLVAEPYPTFMSGRGTPRDIGE